jgi:integrase
MASVKREETSRGPRWRVRYRRPDGTETSQRFDRRQAADDFAIRVEHDRRSGLYVDPAGPRTPLAEVVERWKVGTRHGPATVASRDADLRNWVLPQLGRYRVGQVGEPELVGFIHTLEARLAPATVERVWAWVTGVFGAAIRLRLLAVNPTVGLAPKPAPRPLLVPLEGDQVEAVIAELPGWYQAPALLAADAGLRGGEAFGVTASRVDLRTLRSRVLHVERQLVTLAGQPSHLKLPKGEKVRAVPIPDQMVEVLAGHMARFPARPVVEDRISRVRAELIFATSAGAAVRRNTFDTGWARAVRRAGLPAGTRFHDLRHYYAAVLIDAGLPEREIGARLGHSSAEVTARYGHLFKAADERTRQAVEASVAARRAAR